MIYLPRNSLFTDYGTAAAIVILTQEIHYSPTTALRHCGSNSYTHPEFIIHRLRHFIEEICLVTAAPREQETWAVQSGPGILQSLPVEIYNKLIKYTKHTKTAPLGATT